MRQTRLKLGSYMIINKLVQIFVFIIYRLKINFYVKSIFYFSVVELATKLRSAQRLNPIVNSELEEGKALLKT